MGLLGFSPALEQLTKSASALRSPFWPSVWAVSTMANGRVCMRKAAGCFPEPQFLRAFTSSCLWQQKAIWPPTSRLVGFSLPLCPGLRANEKLQPLVPWCGRKVESCFRVADGSSLLFTHWWAWSVSKSSLSTLHESALGKVL